ncbi:NarK/NasA family nitrate transporter [Asticcacaulis sp. BYS171W]|uniref:NarK/NasA family nitrate transporter n=1 Tax=Asticcacaulis aquaticus TaxID=2984212 RepID=A0ABT5HRU9_9CAUL|nr:nitrate/nitrite transporter [Asticcacaulis aquaticus]MDC7682795.1 NarK/NasA family nitrate transporter [Asticcacaulis aquaticus]
MISKDFLKAGHPPTLLSAFLYFDMSFMVWVLLGALGVQIAADLGLSPAQKGLMVAVPILTGAVLRMVAGVLVDRIGPKTTGAIGQAIVISGLILAFLVKIDSFAGILALGGVLGVAGASFAVALPLASRWYPPQYQGVALGIAGAGNSGTVFASLFAPSLAKAFGWSTVFGIAAVPLIAAFAFYLLFAKDAPNPPAPKRFDQYLAILKQSDAWWFLLFYGVSFGGFVGLSSSLNIYFNTEYGLEPVTAGFFTAACVFAGSMLRPVGGGMADKIGGIRTLSIMYVVAAFALVIISFKLPTAITSLLFFIIGMGALGMANGAVFQLVPQRFRSEIGVMTGLVGMFGGIGGFYLATSLGLSKQALGTYQPGLIGFACLALIAFGGLTLIKRRWRTTWGGALKDVRI